MFLLALSDPVISRISRFSSLVRTGVSRLYLANVILFNLARSARLLFQIENLFQWHHNLVSVFATKIFEIGHHEFLPALIDILLSH